MASSEQLQGRAQEGTWQKGTFLDHQAVLSEAEIDIGPHMSSSDIARRRSQGLWVSPETGGSE